VFASASQFTSLRVGGPIGDVVEVASSEGLIGVLRSIGKRDPSCLLVVGGGTNLVVSDEGFPGTVLRLVGGTCVREDGHGEVGFIVDGGVNWDDFVVQTLASGCTGVEMMSGIPGTVGAAPIQNIAAYGQQVADAIDWVEVIERQTLRVRRLDGSRCGFAFRTSSFKTEWRNRYIVSRVRFRLARAQDRPPSPSTYVDIERYFARTGTSPTVPAERRRAVLAARGTKSMLLDEMDDLSRSVGSFFVNPLVSQNLAESLANRYRTSGMSVQYLEGPGADLSGRRRIPAAHLLRFSGFRPGDSWGRVKLSEKHLLALVACPGATATDIWLVGSYLRERVFEKTAVQLDFEAVFVGDFPPFGMSTFQGMYDYTPSADVEPEWINRLRTDGAVES
jgi:UDP-N-acetylmuramate dehydrogenase